MRKRVKDDESTIENISIKNRSMVVAEDYYNFCSNDWLDAKAVLDLKCAEQSEDKTLQFLNSVLQARISVLTVLMPDKFRYHECNFKILIESSLYTRPVLYPLGMYTLYSLVIYIFKFCLKSLQIFYQTFFTNLFLGQNGI